MSRERKVIVESSPKAPVYIITFSTLAALLLAFFVVLLSLGSVRDETLMDEGKGGGWSFIESFKAGFGAGKNIDTGSSYYYSVENPEKDTDDKTVDARSERVRRILSRIESFSSTMPSPIAAEKVNFALTDIQFSSEEVSLNAEGEQFLREFCAGLVRDESTAKVKLCVLCIGGSGKEGEKEMVLAAKRARAVEEFLRANLPATGKWATYSWGAGPDSTWIAADAIASTQPQVLIAILR